MQRLRGVPLRWIVIVLALAFVADWLVMNAADGLCGNEDTVECTPVGWALFGTWGILAITLAALLLWAATRWLWHLARRRRD